MGAALVRGSRFRSLHRPVKKQLAAYSQIGRTSMLLLCLTGVAFLVSIAATTAVVALIGDVIARRRRPTHGLPMYRKAWRDGVSTLRWLRHRIAARRASD